MQGVATIGRAAARRKRERFSVSGAARPVSFVE